MNANNGNYYQEGYNAFMQGVYESECPYIYRCAHGRKQLWLNGFHAAQDKVLNDFKAMNRRATDASRII